MPRIMLLQIFAARPATIAAMDDLAAHFFQQRLGPFEALRSADHEGQGAGGRTADAAGNRSVEKSIQPAAAAPTRRARCPRRWSSCR